MPQVHIRARYRGFDDANLGCRAVEMGRQGPKRLGKLAAEETRKRDLWAWTTNSDPSQESVAHICVAEECMTLYFHRLPQAEARRIARLETRIFLHG